MGPLSGIKVLEMAGLAPGPYCGMILADFGADVIRVDRVPRRTPSPNPIQDALARGKRSIGIDLKHPDGVAALLDLLEQGDVLVDTFRPGVMERLGLGPDVALARNPRLVYSRLTGWGQEGPYAAMAGHDINYIAVSGTLSAFGRKGEKPLAPVNLLGDFAGGGMLCAMGILLALVERASSGEGQVVDAAMVDGAANIGSFLFGFQRSGLWHERGTNMLDTGAHFYDTYETKDGKYMSVGAIEPQFYAEFVSRLGVDPDALPSQMDQDEWPTAKAMVAEAFRAKTRDEWCAIYDGTDACVAPVLDLGEVMAHPHNQARQLLEPGIPAPVPAPRLSRTPGDGGGSAPLAGADTRAVLDEMGFAAERIEALFAAGAVGDGTTPESP